MSNSNRTQFEIHPEKGLKMDLVTDRWIRICIGVSLVLFAATPFVLALGKALHWLRWW